MYDSDIGRWMTPDPMNQHFSPYMAMGNDPVGSTDATGGEDDDGGQSLGSNKWTGGLGSGYADGSGGIQSWAGANDPSAYGPNTNVYLSGKGPGTEPTTTSGGKGPAPVSNTEGDESTQYDINSTLADYQTENSNGATKSTVVGAPKPEDDVLQLEPVDVYNHLGNLFRPSSNYGASLSGNIGYTLSSFWTSFANKYGNILNGKSNNTQKNGVRLYNSSSNGTLANKGADAPSGKADSYIEDASIGISTSGKNFSTKLGQFVVIKDAALEANDGFQRGWTLIEKAVGAVGGSGKVVLQIQSGNSGPIYSPLPGSVSIDTVTNANGDTMTFDINSRSYTPINK